MYTVYMKNPVDAADKDKGFDKQLLYSPLVNGTDIYNMSLTLQISAAGSFAFTIPPTHALFGSLRKLVTIIEIYRDDKIYWRGRVLDMRRNISNYKTVNCEGMLACLNDILIRYTAHSSYNIVTSQGTIVNTLGSKFRTALKSYTDACTNDNRNWYRRVKSGLWEFDYKLDEGGSNVNVNNVIDKDSEYLSTAYDRINRFVSQFNGHLFVRYDEIDTFVDFTNIVPDNKNEEVTSEIITECSQKIEFGKNLLELDEFLDGTKLCTGLWISGALEPSLSDLTPSYDAPQVYPNSDNDTYQAHAQLPKSESDNQLGRYNGKFGYTMFNNYGLIDRKIDGMDIGDVGNMASVRSNVIIYAANEFSKNLNKALSLTISAVDLTMLGVDTDEFEIGKLVRVVSAPHGIDERLMISKIVINLDDPANNQYTIGGDDQSLTGMLYGK